jgi:hypothetical protein
MSVRKIDLNLRQTGQIDILGCLEQWEICIAGKVG